MAKDARLLLGNRQKVELAGAGYSRRQQQRRIVQKMSRFRDRRTLGVRGSVLEGCRGHLRRPVWGWREKVGKVEDPLETDCRHGRLDDRAR
ncbi:hypothetical protein FOXG_18240 [Fusarium oxysporum f. sp. lycopersici 4287]|uniref:Uncharacterized protein n=1 Tax=Fusarium oxysporum f. sp. lycopersici (strain 4287 / CBS 123668 / FGSC 9935 / NRRL 34936) TaxID=426428 RepID=A0A0J9UDK4_FUSO4|nr:hypothetical protein FOXG_18240 [Fusarium oxysporum f. sp. lycopersici 4287]KNA97448.1 hypothetical protein FOXG_18240 [Fusarium oxysporum f. sp. lycopersici 4287]